MNLLWHYFKKQVWSLRWILGFGAVMFSTHTLLTDYLIFTNNHIEHHTELVIRSGMWRLLNACIWMTIIVTCIQNEPVNNSKSFWSTRPIPLIYTNIGKLFVIVLLLVIPSLVVLYANCVLLKVEPGLQKEIIRTLLELELLSALGCIWLATYTKNIAIFWGVISTLFILFCIITSFLPNGENTFYATKTKADFNLWIYVVGFASAIVAAHWFKKSKLGLTIGVAALVTIFLVDIFWPWAWFDQVSHMVSGTKHIDFEIDPSSIEKWRKIDLSGSRLLASTKLKRTSDQSDSVAYVSSVDTTYFPSDGGKPVAIMSPYLATPQYLSWIGLLQKDNPELTMVNAPSATDTEVQLEMKNGEIPAITNGELKMHVQGRLLKLKRITQLPIIANKVERIPNGFLKIKDTRRNGGLTMQMEEIRYESDNLCDNANVYLLVDEVNHCSIIPQRIDIPESFLIYFDLDWTIKVTDCYLTVEKYNSNPALSAELQSDNLKNLVLYVYKVQEGAPFESQLYIPNYTFNFDNK